MARGVNTLALPLVGERVRIEADGPEKATLVRISDGAAAGELVVEGDERVLTVRKLWIDPAYRGYGLGSETARLVREAAEASGCAVLRAWAPPNLGLAVYFWIRMGLHPLHGPGPDGGIWFERRLRETASS